MVLKCHKLCTVCWLQTGPCQGAPGNQTPHPRDPNRVQVRPARQHPAATHRRRGRGPTPAQLVYLLTFM